MKNKVMLFDAEGSPVGETFTRRARQLVSQQRAEWIGENSIRFAPDAAIDESECTKPISEASEESEPKRKKTDSEALLYYLAEKKLKRRRLFLLHTILMLPGLVFCLVIHEITRSDEFTVFILGAWLSPYFIHVFIFISNWLKTYNPEGYTRKLEREVDKLRSYNIEG